ncbi:5' nucleotidase [Phaffia rhodozyma]|uniref:5' nucleotidase n=1 Tax=Phaffia rhodozyma TaxID=264483 RepID=A0A0F7SUZ8_PHARH|nr:5' nucleotidase [Phaffia rhodozyma]
MMSRELATTDTTSAINFDRELQWGDVNFISTTDTHGWLVGHQKSSFPEPNYSGDFGDFASFIHWMKQKAVEKDVDLLLVDSGDLHDGNPTTDAAVEKGEVNGARSGNIFAQIPYDALAANVANISQDVHYNFAPKWNGRYLTSNVNITVTVNGVNTSVPIGERFTKFTTRKGRKVTAFGVLFNFTGAASNVKVQDPVAMINETWFNEAIVEEPDFFLVLGHMPVQGSNSQFAAIQARIRSLHPHVPVFTFGGHDHIRDCLQYDGRSIALSAGRYMETIGWASSTLPAPNTTDNLVVSRRYIDANRNSYAWHTKRDDVFDTKVGINITQQLQNVVSFYNVSTPLGEVPQDYYLNRSPYGANDSLLTVLANQVLPTAIVDANRTNPKIVIVNSGSQRFDLYQGPFTDGDNYIVSPFVNLFNYVELPNRVASKVLNALITGNAPRRRALEEAGEYDNSDGAFERAQRRAWENYVRAGAAHEDTAKRDLELKARSANSTLTLGYVTEDKCPGLGDDTLHNPIPYSSDIPTYISSPNPVGLADEDPVDLVFLDFFAPTIAKFVNQIDPTLNLTTAVFKTYGPTSPSSEVLGTDNMWGKFVAKAWNN